MKMSNANKFLSDSAAREAAINRTEVLEHVKALFVMPGLEALTMDQVAEYYSVPASTIRNVYNRHSDEFQKDGAVKTPAKSIALRLSHHATIYTEKGKRIAVTTDGDVLRIPNVGMVLFPKRAVLRAGMLLRDSEVAKEIRNQLLNIVEVVGEKAPELLTQDIDTEKEILDKMSQAFTKGDLPGFMTLSNELYRFQRRHIEALKDENARLANEARGATEAKAEAEQLRKDTKIMSGEIQAWTNRSRVNKAIRLIASRTGLKVGWVWRLFYDELLYQHHINLKARRKGSEPLLANIRGKDEWFAVTQALSAVCENHKLSPSMIFERSKLMPDDLKEADVC